MSRKAYLFVAFSLALLIVVAISVFKERHPHWKAYQLMYKKQKSALEAERLRRIGASGEQIAKRIKALQKEPVNPDMQ
ncbi:MAG: hypothetical protein DRH11_13285 [Deltaproteobacteria bacterium]|nr:hypothetical protein [Deltaproteobacteria bacterium]RLB31441.1 MAG: hypothetical protein DRH11_13285 [Deltaproteobacteria bacterium]